MEGSCGTQGKIRRAHAGSAAGRRCSSARCAGLVVLAAARCTADDLGSRTGSTKRLREHGCFLFLIFAGIFLSLKFEFGRVGRRDLGVGAASRGVPLARPTCPPPEGAASTTRPCCTVLGQTQPPFPGINHKPLRSALVAATQLKTNESRRRIEAAPAWVGQQC